MTVWMAIDMKTLCEIVSGVMNDNKYFPPVF